MWRLNTPNSNTSSADLATALTLVNGNPVYPLTDIEKARILQLYQAYDANLGNPCNTLKGTVSESALLEAIHNAYNQVQIGGRLEDYRDRLKLTAEICPYCGFGAITDLDHHLPRSKFKAHAIYAKNLIPCCQPCNNLKRAKAGDKPEGQFSHVYFGQRPVEPFLIAEAVVQRTGLVVTFSLERTATLDPNEFARLKFQFDTLDLNVRYKAPINTYLGTLRTSIEIFASAGTPALKEFLKKSYITSRRDFGPNHWQSALLKCLAESEEFCGGGFQHCFGRRDPAI
ncbi:HNH endonuclease signature motif containing protein [Pseudomonas sp. CC6-YY-74]|uniref:HNH endonuclease signature motif containing protein n=1 Tax=Pseudomonas sp. CC6-YY-74 TaxID=1930532 RepID=UPI0012AB8B4F|nr:HNH endonuclease signature motif containing protein [Pseudomonas sp. CC6-YY-74]